MRERKCFCNRKAPRCAHCLQGAVNARKRRRERGIKERAANKIGAKVLYGEMDIAYANRILSQPCPSTPITWEHISAGRSNS